MSENLETYLYISSNTVGIYLYEKKNFKNLYEEELNFINKTENLNFETLSKFLDDNIFKIEKLIGKFITNIYLVIENKKILNVKFCIKKKNYEKIISKKYLENTLTEAKDLFRENYQDNRILHIIVNNYFINGKNYPYFSENLQGDELSIELQFIYISNSFSLLFEKVLENFQIRIIQYLDGCYIKNFFESDDIHLTKMISKMKDGYNENEIRLVPKNMKKLGFFERFFQLFS